MLTPDQAKWLRDYMISGLENEYATTRKVLAAYPEGQLSFKLGDKGRPAAELMWHIVQSEAWFAQGLIDAKFAEEGEGAPPATVAEIVALYEQRQPALLEKVKTLTGDELMRAANFFNVFNLPVVMYLGFWNNHTVHHRGQLSTYIRALNAKVPDIYGGSADEPFAMPAPAGN
jgi:uncharacterized damage-inducible protein DinB